MRIRDFIFPGLLERDIRILDLKITNQEVMVELLKVEAKEYASSYYTDQHLAQVKVLHKLVEKRQSLG